MATLDPLRIGISACLLGEAVRYDGGHKRDAYLVDILGPLVDWVPTCPEMDLGLGTPREPIRLVRRDAGANGLRLQASNTTVDLTRRMYNYARRQVKVLARSNLDGYILKEGSPSCGMARVRIWNNAGRPVGNGRGMFAEALMSALPDLPIEDEARLQNPRRREHFIDRMLAYQQLRKLFLEYWTVGGLAAFHAAHELMLMAYSPSAYRALGRLVASGASCGRRTLAKQYESAFMTAVSKMASCRRHAIVLTRIAGHFESQLSGNKRLELTSLIDEYRRGLVPRTAPLSLICYHVKQLKVTYLSGQAYLNRSPAAVQMCWRQL